METLYSLLNPEQREYNDLAERIDRLSKVEELRFYELNFQVSQKNYRAAEEMVSIYRMQKEGNDRMILTEEERIWMFKVLEEKRHRKGLSRKEFKYLSFVKRRYNLSTVANAPEPPQILKISLHEFVLQFGTNAHRLNLIQKLVNGLERSLELYEMKHINILVGGSFLDAKPLPGDVDVTLVLPVNAFRQDLKHVKMNRLILESRDVEADGITSGKKRLDITKLPDNYNEDHYMAYDILTMLGRPAHDRAEEGLVNNEFGVRKIFQISITADELKEASTEVASRGESK